MRGYNYHKYLSVNVDYSEVSKSEQGWKMLMADRVEFFINSLEAINRYVNNNNIDLTNIKIDKILTKNLYIRFSKTEKSKKLIKIYDNRMEELIQSDEIKKLFEKWNSIYPNFELIEN